MKHYLLVFYLCFVFVFSNAQNNNWLPAGLPDSLYGLDISCLYSDTANDVIYVGSVLKSWYSWDHQTIAKYDGNSWDTLGDFNWKIRTMINYKGNLIVGGEFTKVNGISVGYITMFDGTSWVNIGNFDYPVINLKIIDDTLYAMGYLSHIDSISINGIAKWNGNTWSDVYSFPKTDNQPWVYDITKYNGVIYVSGNFYSQQQSIMDIAMYKNNTWQSVGQGFFGGFNGVNRLAVYKGELYAAGLIRKPDGNAGHGIQKWDGFSWSEVGTSLKFYKNNYGGNVIVHDMLIHNDELYVSGVFNYAGDVPAMGIAKWNGSTWCGFGLNGWGANTLPGTTDSLNGYCTTMDFYHDTLFVKAGDTLNGQFTNFIIRSKGVLQIDTCSTPLSINESIALNENNIHIFPNPAQNYLNIQLNNPLSKDLEIQFYDIVGKQIKSYSLKNVQPHNKIDISELKSGVYFIKVGVGNDEFVFEKFVKM